MRFQAADPQLSERLKKFEADIYAQEFVCKFCNLSLKGSDFEIRLDARTTLNKKEVIDIYRLKKCIKCHKQQVKQYYARVGGPRINHFKSPQFKKFRENLDSQIVYCRQCKTKKPGTDFFIQHQHRLDYKGLPYLSLSVFRMCKPCWCERMKEYQQKRKLKAIKK